MGPILWERITFNVSQLALAVSEAVLFLKTLYPLTWKCSIAEDGISLNYSSSAVL